MKKHILILVIMLIVTVFAISQSKSLKQTNSTQTSNNIFVVTTFYPLAHFAQQVGQDKITVSNLTPAGIEPHDFEPSPQDIVSLYSSDLFIYNGTGFEPWLNSMITEIKENTTVVNTSLDVATLLGTKDEHENEESPLDPHVWLDPNLAIHQITTIKDALIAIDPKNAEFYEQNANEYISQLTALDLEFQNGLANCNKRTIVTSHNAFQYLATRYNFEILSISGISPDQEPSAQALAQIADFVKENNIQYIFFETLVSPKFSQTIARETGAQTATLNPLEGLTPEQENVGDSYLTVQRANLISLQTALECNQ